MSTLRVLASRAPRCVARCGFAAALLLLGALGSGCRHKEKTPVERGQGIFIRTCAGCHGTDGRGGTTRTGFATPPKDLTDPALHSRLGRDGIKHTIEVGNGDMPAFGALMAPEDIDALVAYIESIKR
ncbi:MAG: cytochrome c [Polyangiaceae bacterium]|nr:cytochrome c [Myxococcales bacterium]MCB9588499.1 cytochrome c [Polyangiaceae bacterium]